MLRILFFVLIFILIITSALKIFYLMLYMQIMIERKNIYLTGILPLPKNLLKPEKKKKKRKRIVWKRQLIFG
jgi:hypothetical protein